MRQPSSVCVLVVVATFVAMSWSPTRADEAVPAGSRRVLGESAGGPVPHPCTSPDCATVVAIRHGDLVESPLPARVQGAIQRQPPFGAYDPHAPPIDQPSFLVQKRTDIWVIELRRRDGTIQSIEQNFPVLFQVGDEVVVEGDHIRAPD